MTVNEHILQITGTTTLAGPLKQGERYRMALEADVYSITQKDNQDGTVNMLYKTRQTGLCLITDNLGNKQYAEGKKSHSARCRGAIWHYWNENNIEIEFEQFYDKVMSMIIGNIDNLIILINQ
jgi:hypothetical protein